MSEGIDLLYVAGAADPGASIGASLEGEDDRFDVETVAGDEEATARLDDVDCVVSARNLPDGTALELLEAVREGHPDLPFVLYPDAGSESLAGEAVAAGATGYVPRNRDGAVETLAARIAGAVAETRSERTLRDQHDRLQQLHRATRELMTAETPAEIAERASDTAREVLQLPLNGVYLYDADRDTLVPEAVSDPVYEALGDPPAIGPGEGLTWSAYENGEVRVYGDVREAEDVLNPETVVRSELLVSLGEHGVLTVASKTVDDFTDADVTAAKILGANVEAALNRAEREQQRQEQRRRFQMLFERLTEPAVEVEYREGRPVVTQVNAAFEAVFGYPAETIVGEPLGPYIVPEDRRGEVARLNEQLEAGGRLDAEEVTRLTADGPREFLLQAAVYDDGTSGFGIYTDITERKERERQLQRQNERLEEFASIVSHDLRNPLSVAGASLELVAEECDSDHVGRVRRAVDRMDELVEDLLTVARVGQAATETEPVDLAAAARRCWGTVETAEATLATETDRTVLADEGGLARLFENLVRNAIEHGREDVTVTVGALADGFYVADDGPGIPESDRDRVLESGYSTAEDGTGFGLSIVSEVAEAHEWTIEVTESDDGGARFEFRGVEFVDGE